MTQEAESHPPMSQMTVIGPDLPLPRSQAYRDWLGVGASVLCAIHCAAMPFVIGFLPLLGLSFLADPAFHKWMVGVCLVLALLAFVPGWRRHHRWAPTLIGLGGLVLISLAAFAGPEECCPTPCATTTSSETTLMSVAGPGENPGPAGGAAPCASSCCETETAAADAGDGEEAACVASCCSTTTETTVVAVEETSVPADSDEESACAAACCATESTIIPAEPAVATVAVAEETSCSAGCCPEEGDSVVLAGSGGFLDSDFMALVWLWMTPIGGVILVVAHLTNHRLSAHCKAACCSSDRDPQAAS